jgi:hypothetical protein
MKQVLLTLLLAGWFVPAVGQQGCFSNTSICPYGPIRFAPPGQSLNLFKPSLALPQSTLVAPLKFSPQSRQFFQFSSPDGKMGEAFKLPGASGSALGFKSAAGADSLNRSHIGGASVSTKGGTILTPGSPKF